MTKDEAIRSILDGAAAEPHSGTMCVPENGCGTCDGIRALLAAGRKEGFEKAREMAAERYADMATNLRADAERAGNEKLRLERLELAEQWESEARVIRAMRDGEGTKAPDAEERASRLCDCTGCPHRREEGCP